MTDATEQVEAAKRALAEAQAALAKAEADAETSGRVSSDAQPAPQAPLSRDDVDSIRSGYAFDGSVLELGALVNGDALPDVQVRIPVGMLNRHALVAGATGTGKTRTLQVLAEQLSTAGVPVFAADIKGDLTGVATPGQPSEKLLERTTAIGQDWAPAAFPVELFSLGGTGVGVPVRATISGFGPLLLSKVLGLNDTQESSLGLVFHYAEKAGLPLVDLADLRAVLNWLVGDGKDDLKDLGGLSKATAGVILRELITFADQGADAFFGEPEMDTAELLRTASDGRGVISLLEVPGVQDKPALFSTFLMWLLADLFNDLPEVGDTDKPKLVFFFDEAHLLFKDASKSFLAQIVQTVRLIRSKGVGIVFVTQTPKDVPDDVLAQLGSRIQHQLRAHTPDAAKALRATVSTYPTSGYDLEEVLTQLATGEAIVTVMSEKGAPTPVAWTRLRAPQGLMDPSSPDAMGALVAASPLQAKYGTALDPESAREILARKLETAAEAAKEKTPDAQAEYERMQREWEKSLPKTSKAPRSTSKPAKERDPVTDFLSSRQGKSIVNNVIKGIFGTLKRR
ncbi:helicase HerA-like domain-containing protein [Cryobacterium sp. BB307]|uniref:helicase HerA-like domain-containing protein n=1 Tax=Cryobacterium sp. BB307 TaxID=2716317 RepID=UPI0014476599|nr:helicase HerA-like domain-containing protein [Cryobacterium sp. BB307]